MKAKILLVLVGAFVLSGCVDGESSGLSPPGTNEESGAANAAREGAQSEEPDSNQTSNQVRADGFSMHDCDRAGADLVLNTLMVDFKPPANWSSRRAGEAIVYSWVFWHCDSIVFPEGAVLRNASWMREGHSNISWTAERERPSNGLFAHGDVYTADDRLSELFRQHGVDAYHATIDFDRDRATIRMVHDDVEVDLRYGDASETSSASATLHHIPAHGETVLQVEYAIPDGDWRGIEHFSARGTAMSDSVQENGWFDVMPIRGLLHEAKGELQFVA